MTTGRSVSYYVLGTSLRTGMSSVTGTAKGNDGAPAGSVVGYATPDLRVAGSSPRLGVEIT